MKKLLFFIVLSFFAVSVVGAVDLVNKDSKKYDVKISDVGTTHSSIEGNTTKSGICSDCEIEVVGVGTMRASGDEKIIIENGSLKKE